MSRHGEQGAGSWNLAAVHDDAQDPGRVGCRGKHLYQHSIVKENAGTLPCPGNHCQPAQAAVYGQSKIISTLWEPHVHSPLPPKPQSISGHMCIVGIYISLACHDFQTGASLDDISDCSRPTRIVSWSLDMAAMTPDSAHIFHIIDRT